MKNKSFVDYLGNPLQAGDTVVFIDGFCYRGIEKEDD